MGTKMALAEQIINCVTLNYGGTIDSSFMKTMNAIADDIRKMEEWNSEMTACLTDFMDCMDAMGSIKASDRVYQDIVNASGE